MRRFFFLFCLCVISGLATGMGLASCGPLKQNSPFSEQTQTTASQLNSKSINTLSGRTQTIQDFQIATLADSHQNYDDLEVAVTEINKTNVDFVAHLGDFTNQGYNIEFDLFVARITELGFPFITVLGNHDALTKGKSLYQRIFGNFNDIFDYRGYRFIILNNNNLDFQSDGGVDFDWLRRVVNASTLPIVLMYHINPDNSGYFTDADQTKFNDIVIGSKVRLMLHGHNHTFQTEFKDGILRHMTARTEHAQWSRITLKTNEIIIEDCRGGTCAQTTAQSFP